jgi:hypothetical protein
MEDSSMDWPTAIVAASAIITVMTLVTVVVTVAIWQGLVSWRARMGAAREEAYQRLSEQAEDAQRRAADGIDRVFTELAELRQRTMEIERMLKDVG